jgi:hypothetical protein
VTSPDPFIPRILRSEQGTVAVQVDPNWFPGATEPVFRLAHLGPDGVELMRAMKMPLQPGAVLQRSFFHQHEGTVFVELTP